MRRFRDTQLTATRALGALVGFAACIGLAPGAFAQSGDAAGSSQPPAQVAQTGPVQPASPAATASQANPLQEVVVTGSRVVTTDVNSPNPITSIDSNTIQALGLTSAGDVVNELPQNSNFFSNANVGEGNFDVGAQLANLRGLNPFFGTRTLTLVNTQRFVQTTAGGAVDLNVVPSILVKRVEVVTGGASAVYGADAVAGVVNIILDNTFEGFKFQTSDGETSYHDGNELNLGLEAGTGFAGSRGHTVFGAEFEDDKGIGYCGQVRPWCGQNWDEFTNGGYLTNGLPHYIIAPNGTNFATEGGLLQQDVVIPGVGSVPGAILGQFNSAGTALVPYNAGNYSADSAFAPEQGGDGPGAYYNNTIRPPVRHYALYSSTTYQITDGFQAGVDVSYTSRTAANVQNSSGSYGFPLELIEPDNAYLPASVQAAMGGSPAWFYNYMGELLPQTNATTNNVGRVVVDFNGNLFIPHWTWDGYLEYGENKTHEQLENLEVNYLTEPSGTPAADEPGQYDFFSWALDAVRNSAGQIVCAATIPGNPAYNPLAAGCQPLDLFGVGNASAAALAYAYRTLHEDSTFKQEVASGNIHGNLFSGWGAGPIGLAAGLEYRRSTANVTHAQQAQPWYNDYTLTYGADYSGAIDVVEGYSELNVPILKDLPGAKRLEFDGAIRETENKNEFYTANASSTTSFPTWKAGLVYQATNWLRLRGTRSRDARAPSFYELYEQTSATGGIFGSIYNPLLPGPAGVPNDNIHITAGSNVALRPEAADTTTVGIVLTPEGFLKGLRFSADWYQIKLNDAISELGAQALFNACLTAGSYCQYVQSGAGGLADLTYINNLNLNIATYTTRGIDYEADYVLPFSRFAAGRNDSVSIRVIASYLYDMIVDTGAPGVPVVNYAGQSGPTAAFGNFNTSPKWQGNSFITYLNGPFTGTVTVRYIGPGKFEIEDPTYDLPILAPGDPGYSTTYVSSINNNSVASATYVNLSLAYTFALHGDSTLQVFGSVDNLFNRDPPIAPGGNGYPTNPVYFDTYGRFWKLGVRVTL